MLFNSVPFLLFAACFYSAWPIVRRFARGRFLFLTVSSLVFYGWNTWWFSLVLVATGLLDFYVGLAIVRWPAYRKSLLVASLTGNLGCLATFKYLAFATTNLNTLLTTLHSGHSIPIVSLILPVGLSFYTFQSMSYTIDIYRGKLAPTRSILHFFTSISLFPHLVAGPIVRASNLLPQFLKAEGPSPDQTWDGLRLIASGFFKKTVLADNLAPYVNQVFQPSHTASCGFWWLASIIFAMQIYYDFSGYTDIARGLAKWMGYEFSLNFYHPYTATSFRDFWHRWHISLSTWFRDYVYFSLGGSRRSRWITHRNLWITMLLSGIWHGANWKFVIWAALHAAFLSLERLTGWPEWLQQLPGGRHLSAALVFLLVCVAWVFFRADSTGEAWRIVSVMLHPSVFHASAVSEFARQAVRKVGVRLLTVLAICILWELYYYCGIDRAWLRAPRLEMISAPIITAILLTCSIYFRGPGNAFIYFQF